MPDKPENQSGIHKTTHHSPAQRGMLVMPVLRRQRQAVPEEAGVLARQP